MTPAVPHRARADAEMTIGEVLGQLSADFPDVSISKIRLWESEGLVEPSRTPSGYRKFSHDDVERLRYAMSLQRDRYWPLRRIREHLDAVQRGAEDPVHGAGGPRSAPAAVEDDDQAPPFLRSVGATRLSADELCSRAGLRPEQLEALVSFGLVQPSAAGWYDEVSAEVAAAAGELSAFGIEPRHLRAFRTAAEREVGLVEQVVSPLLGHRATASRARADDVARQISASSLRLHAALVRSGLVRAGLG